MQNIETYYESLGKVYDAAIAREQDLESQQDSFMERLSTASGISLVLSVVPVLPYAFVAIAAWMQLEVGGVDLRHPTVATFGIVWFTFCLSIGTIFFCLDKLNSAKTALSDRSGRPIAAMSPEQVSFVTSYRAWKELKLYSITRIDSHLETAQKSIQNACRRQRESPQIEVLRLREAEVNDVGSMHIRDLLPPTNIPSSVAQLGIIAEEFAAIMKRSSWLPVDARLVTVLEAINSIADKVFWRIVRRDDLPQVVNVLEHLSRFTYAFLPEHETNLTQEALAAIRADGTIHLEGFTVAISSMTPSSAPDRTANSNRAAQRTLYERIVDSGYPGMFLRFCGWFVVLLCLLALSIVVLGKFFEPSPDTVVSLLLGVSVGGAAALTVSVPSRSNAKQSASSGTMN